MCWLPAGPAPARRAPHERRAGLLWRGGRPGGGGCPPAGAAPGADCVHAQASRVRLSQAAAKLWPQQLTALIQCLRGCCIASPVVLNPLWLLRVCRASLAVGAAPSLSAAGASLAASFLDKGLDGGDATVLQRLMGLLVAPLAQWGGAQVRGPAWAALTCLNGIEPGRQRAAQCCCSADAVASHQCL